MTAQDRKPVPPAVFEVWRSGPMVARYRRSVAEWAMPVARFRELMHAWTARDRETAVFLTGDLDQVPLVGAIRGCCRTCAAGG